jgi:hypothetical protein
VTANPSELANLYERRISEFSQRRDTLARRSLLYSNLRGLSFAVFAISLGFTLFGRFGTTAVTLSLSGFVVFVTLVFRHGKIIDALDLAERWVKVNEAGLLRVKPKGFHELHHLGLTLRPNGHAYADDLDLFGKGSLFQKLCVAHTEMGQRRLAEFLLTPSPLQTLLSRQAAVSALAPELELRQKFEALSLGTLSPARKGEPLGSPMDLTALIQWAENASDHADTRARLRWMRWMPLLTLACALAASLGWFSRWVVLLLLIGHIAALLKTRSLAGPVIEMLARTDRALMQVGPLLSVLEGHPVTLTNLSGLREQLQTGSAPPSAALAALERINSWFELRHQGMIYPLVNLLTLWDLHCLAAFEGWKRRHGARLNAWFDCIAEMEALSSLAGLLHDEPQCCIPEFVEIGPHFEAEQLGHPLIAPADRVSNDVMSLEAGRALLVTGSNMSGKSTFLRSMGLAAVLALAGGPVCAKRLRLSLLQVATSMRISDSLAGGVSHFYAELRKLKAVLDATQATIPVFFLLDEVLHGTNSRERQVGARFVLSQLLEAGALGAVSTHDYELCRLEGALAENVTLVHFRESVTRGKMTFDYLLRPGPVTEGNALRLMRGLGIEVPLEP